MNEWVGEIIGGALVGASLGLVGAGGAILSVPIFGVLLGHPPRDAVVEALLVTGTIAVVGATRAALHRGVDWPRVALFGLPGMAGAAIGGWGAQWLSGAAQMGLFALVAAVAAWRMAFGKQAGPPSSAPRSNKDAAAAPPLAAAPPQHPARAAAESIAAGLGIGVLTGVIGVGGGFLLVPALVVLLRVPMKLATGTSLAIIALNCALGYASRKLSPEAAQIQIDWQAVALVSACGAAGALAGSHLGGKLPQHTLRRVFAGLLLVAAVLAVVQALR